MRLKTVFDNLTSHILNLDSNEWAITNPMILGSNVYLVYNGVKYWDYFLPTEPNILLYEPSAEAKLNFGQLGDIDHWLLKVGVFFKDGITELEIATPFSISDTCATNNPMSLDNNFTIINTAVWNMAAPSYNAKA